MQLRGAQIGQAGVLHCCSNTDYKAHGTEDTRNRRNDHEVDEGVFHAHPEDWRR